MLSLSFEIFNQKGHAFLKEGRRFGFAGGCIFGVTWEAEFVREIEIEDNKRGLPGGGRAELFDFAAAHFTEKLWPIP